MQLIGQPNWGCHGTPMFSVFFVVPNMRLEGHYKVGKQQQHCAVTAWKIQFLISVQSLNGLDPDFVSTTIG